MRRRRAPPWTAQEGSRLRRERPHLATADRVDAILVVMDQCWSAAVQYERASSLWDRVADPVAVAGMTRSALFLRAAETDFFGSRLQPGGRAGRGSVRGVTGSGEPRAARDDAGADRLIRVTPPGGVATIHPLKTSRSA